MTDATLPTRQAIEARGRSGRLKVTGKLKVAIDAMLFQAARRADAAALAGITDHSLRAALRKPHVAGYYNAGLQVLRASERARNIHRLAAIRDAADNQPAVQAIKALEQLADEDGRLQLPPGVPAAGYVMDLREGHQQIPGLNIQINVGASERPQDRGGPIVDVTPSRAAPDVAPAYGRSHGLQRAPAIETEPLPAEPIFRHPLDD